MLLPKHTCALGRLVSVRPDALSPEPDMSALVILTDVVAWLPPEPEDPLLAAAGEQYAAQELLALLPPGTGVGQVEAMIKELRTAAALEVRWAWSHGFVCLLGARGHCCSEWHWLRLPVVLWCSAAWLLWACGSRCARQAAYTKGLAEGKGGALSPVA